MTSSTRHLLHALDVPRSNHSAMPARLGVKYSLQGCALAPEEESMKPGPDGSVLRGMAFGLLFALPLWALIGLAVWWVIR